MRTLDYLAAKTAHEMVEAAKQHNAPKDIENVITKALGVLQAQGVYALYLFLYSQAEGNKPATFVLYHLWHEIQDEEVPVPLPEDAKLAPFQTPQFLFCEPAQFRNITQAKYREERTAQKRAQEANQCVTQVNQHLSLWQENGTKFNLDLSQIPSDSDTFDLSYSPRRERQGRSQQWVISPNNDALHHVFTGLPSAREVVLANIRDLTADLDTLLLVRDLYEQTLVYARYHAKALG